MNSMAPVDQNQKVRIDIQNLSFYYGAFKALKNVSLPLYDRKVTAFIGPSGCGKSTLLRVLNRIYELYPKQRAEGKVLLDGENILDGKQDINLILDDRVEEALTRAALWNEVKGKLKESGLSLSGGQQQRLCIARTVATKPEVILLDEPCSALDPISTAKIEELIDELSKDYTIVMVTHNMQQASRVSDYTAFMFLGELIEFGSTERLFTAPQNKRTEEYITGRFG